MESVSSTCWCLLAPSLLFYGNYPNTPAYDPSYHSTYLKYLSLPYLHAPTIDLL